jgi:hypothetical protein
METINDILEKMNVSSLGVIKEDKKESANLDPHVTEIINKLFGMFWATCPGFEKQFSDPKKLNMAKTQWILAFQDKNFNSLEKIKHGIKKCRFEKLVYIPMIGQFIEWCSPSFEDLGLMPKEKAIKCAYSILRGSEPANLSENQSLILKHSIQETGSFFMKNNIASTVEPVFYRNYEIAIRDFMAGNLKPIAKAIEDKVEKNSIDPQFAEFNCREKSIGKLRDILR